MKTSIRKFFGLTTPADPANTPLGALSIADNVLVTDEGGLVSRPGMEQAGGFLLGAEVLGSHATGDHAALYLATSTGMFVVDSQGVGTRLDNVVYADPFFTDAHDRLVILCSLGGVFAIEPGAPPRPLPYPPDEAAYPFSDLASRVTSCPSSLSATAVHRGRLVVSESLESRSRLWFSLPQLYQAFLAVEEGFDIPGYVTSLVSLDEGLLIVSTSHVYLHTNDRMLNVLADYGGVEGSPAVRYRNFVLIWTKKGLVKYPGMETLTAQNASLPSGNGCSTAVIEWQGDEYFVVCSDGGGDPPIQFQ